MATTLPRTAMSWTPRDPRTLALRDELENHLRGEVHFGKGSRALYATDASNYRQVPIGVVVPHDADDVVETMRICHRHMVPVLSRGAGTSLAGQACNVAIVLDYSKFMNKVLHIDPERRVARAQPGTVLDDLRDAAELYHLTFAPDPSTHNRCTIGGMLGNNACGVHSELGGKTDDNTEELEILTYDGLRLRVGATSAEELDQIISEGGRRGEIYAGLKAIRDDYADLIRTRFPRLLRRVSGFNLNYLLPENGFNVARALVGSEGTCVTILEAGLRLVDSPPVRTLLALGYPDVYIAAEAVPAIRNHHPIGLEGTDGQLIANTRRMGGATQVLELLPEGDGLLLVEFGGDTLAQANQQAETLMRLLSGRPSAPAMRLVEDSAAQPMAV